VPAVRIVRRQQRRKRAGDEPTARVLVSWAEANDALALAGAGRQASETLEEHARRAGPVALRAAVLERCAEYRTGSGGYRLRNLFRVLVAGPR